MSLPRQKKRKKEEQHSSWPLFAFDRLTPTDDQSDRRHSEPEKKCLAQCFPSHVFYLRKKKLFWILQKKAKSQTEKTPNCHKTKTRMKEKKESSKTTSHTTYTTHPIEAPQHTHTNSPKLHP